MDPDCARLFGTRWGCFSLQFQLFAPSLRAQAKQSKMPPRMQSGLLRRFAPRNDGSRTNSLILAALFASEFCISFTLRKIRGRREDRVPAAPAAPCAKIARKAHTGITTGKAESHRPSLRSGFTAYFELSPVNQLVCHRRRRDARGIVADLAPAWARQDHTTSPSASVPHVCRHVSVHRSPPHVRDVRDRPSCRGGTREKLPVICPTVQADGLRHINATGK